MSIILVLLRKCTNLGSDSPNLQNKLKFHLHEVNPGKTTKVCAYGTRKLGTNLPFVCVLCGAAQKIYAGFQQSNI